MQIKQMPETHYRASRLCRVLGNPTAYKVLRLLCRGPKNPTAIARRLKVSTSTVSQVLMSLKLADLVRYDTLPKGRVYWVKHRSVRKMVGVLEKYVDRLVLSGGDLAI